MPKTPFQDRLSAIVQAAKAWRSHAEYLETSTLDLIRHTPVEDLFPVLQRHFQALRPPHTPAIDVEEAHIKRTYARNITQRYIRRESASIREMPRRNTLDLAIPPLEVDMTPEEFDGPQRSRLAPSTSAPEPKAKGPQVIPPKAIAGWDPNALEQTSDAFQEPPEIERAMQGYAVGPSPEDAARLDAILRRLEPKR